jgi:hypothetical protein
MWLSDSNAAVRPLCDSRYGKLHAGKLPFIRGGALYTWLDLIRVSWERVSKTTISDFAEQCC